MKLLAIAIGGAAGSVLRFVLAGAVQRLAGSSTVFPWGTLFVNAFGSFLIGFLFVILIERSTASEAVRLAVTVGLLGGFTTFSTFSLESLRLLQAGDIALAATNVLGQMAVCLVLVWLGWQLARAI